jgi:hypothetical protein
VGKGALALCPPSLDSIALNGGHASAFARSSYGGRGRLAHPTHSLRAAFLPVIQADDHGGIRNDYGIAGGIGRDFEPALHRGDGHGAVRQFLCDRRGVDAVRIGHGDGDIDEHVLGGLAHHAKKAEARMPDRIGDRAFGGLGAVLAVDVDAHAHFGDTAHACH